MPTALMPSLADTMTAALDEAVRPAPARGPRLRDALHPVAMTAGALLALLLAVLLWRWWPGPATLVLSAAAAGGAALGQLVAARFPWLAVFPMC